MPWSRIKIFTAMLAVCLNAGWSAIADTTPPQEYLKWLETLKKEMAERGISQATLDEAFFRNYYQANHKVIKQDRNQSEFVLTTSAYLKRLITPQRVKQGREAYKKLKKRYGENIFGVPLPYLIAFWGVETNFGSNKGGYSAIESLTILSYDKRRPKFFREELYHALKILDNKHIALREMESSWAGAMGHFQFMPSTF